MRSAGVQMRGCLTPQSHRDSWHNKCYNPFCGWLCRIGAWSIIASRTLSKGSVLFLLMTSSFRLRYAPVVRVDEARIDLPGATKNYVPSRVVAEVNPVLHFEATTIDVQDTGAGYLAASYTPIDLDTNFTIIIPGNFNGFLSFVPCVSWIENSVLKRYRLTNVPVGVVPRTVSRSVGRRRDGRD